LYKTINISTDITLNHKLNIVEPLIYCKYTYLCSQIQNTGGLSLEEITPCMV